MFRQKSHPPQLNRRGPVFHIRGALQQSSMRVSVCVGACVCLSACLCVYVWEISFLYHFGGLMRAWDSQRRVNLRHLLCTSSIFLDSWHFTSWTNCQLSKLNFRNDMLKFTPLPLLHSCSLLPLPSLSQHIPLCIHATSQRIFPNNCTCIHTRGHNHAHVYTWEDKWSSVLACSTPSHLSLSVK